ncbi:MAG: DUF922 domain-containing protein [Bacteroidota bacterium]
MKLLTAALLVLFLSPQTLHWEPQDALEFEEEKIPWRADRKLTWADFKGTPNGPEDFVASTNSGVSFSYSYRETNGVGKVEYSVLSNFYPQLSWYRPSKVTDYILAHEQMHFDISELHARKLRKAMEDIPHNRDFKGNSETLYNQAEEDRRTMQKQYDLDSDHSNNRDEEFKWRAYVAKELKVYERWK